MWLGSLVSSAAGAAAVEGHPYGAWSLVPAAIALLLAFWTRNVLLALFLAVVSGSLVLFAHSGEVADLDFLGRFFLPALGTPGYARILLIYLWFLGGILGLWEYTGAARHFAEKASVLVRGPRTAKLVTWLLGCVFHQGGTVSTVLAGTTARPVAERHRVSHEELAYIVDSTASPVATIIPLNVWPAYVAGLVAGTTLAGQTLVSTAEEGTRWFFRAVPFNFYAILAVLLTLLFSLEWWPWMGRSMRTALERARRDGLLDRPGARPMVPAQPGNPKAAGYRPSVVEFLTPLGVLIGVALLPYVARWFGVSRLPYFGSRTDAINEAFFLSTATALVIGWAKGLKVTQLLEAFVRGCQNMTLGAMILGLAVTLAQVAMVLDPGGYLTQQLVARMPYWALPAALMLLCMLISFAVGSSWGTYAVVFPIALPLAFAVAFRRVGIEAVAWPELLAQGAAEAALVQRYVAICFGAVLGGAVFGDQCSPISDTTVLSALFSGCDLMDHVYTQLPMALMAAGGAALLSTALAVLLC